MRLRLTTASVFVLACQAFVPAVGGQAARVVADRSSPRVAAESRRWFDDPVTGRDLADRILATGAPSTYQVVTIAIPDQLPRRGDGRVEIVPREGFTILGARKWSLASLDGKSKVIAIVGIPATAHAGLVTAAEVNFYVAGAPTVTIAVEIDVSLIHALAVRMHASPMRARAGSQLTFAYELVNSGNETESVQTSIVVPKGWRANQRSGPAASLAPDESAARQVVVTVPRDAGTGSFFLRLDVLDRGVVRSSIPVAVEILSGLSRQASAGPEITIAIARASDASGRGSTMTTTSISGPLIDSVRIEARFSAGEATLGPYGQALSRLGSYHITPSVVLSAPSGRLAMGAAGNSFSDLTGLYAYGHGVALDAHRQGWHLIGLAAMSNRTSRSNPQPLLGVRGDIDIGRVGIMSSVSHLRGGSESGRQLDGASLGASVDAGFSTTIQAEIARRRFAGGSGTGWSAEVARGDSRSNARVRVTRAPGGSDAFARAVSEVVASISQPISRRLSFSGSAWRLSDVTAAFARLRSRGWAVRPEYRVHPSTTVALEAHSTELAASTAQSLGGISDFGGAERLVGMSVSTNIQRLYVNASVAGGSVTRTVASRSAAPLEQRSPKVSWNTMASWRGSKTGVELQGRLEEMRNLTGAVTRQSQLSLRGSRLLTTAPGRGASANWELQRVRGFSRDPVTVVRVGVVVPITGMLAVRMYAERNPLFTVSAGRTPWIYAFRVEHSVRVPMVRTPGSSGYVYHDLNGNGKRDDGEPGVDGAVVKRGRETAVTDANGRYHIAADARAPVVLDEGSLPLGFVRQSIGSPDIAVGSNLNAEVRFFVAPRSGIDATMVGLSELRVIARDASGREWVARMTSPSVASFEALPPGTYTLELDLSGVGEPLSPRAALPVLKVTPFEPSFVTIVLDPRPLRIWKAEPVEGQSQHEITAPAPSGIAQLSSSTHR